MASQLPPQQARTESLAIDKRDRMDQLEAPYLRAMEYIKSDKFSEDQMKALGKIRKLVKAGLEKDGEALFILGRVEQILVDAYEFEHVILEYEGLKKSLAEIYPP